MSSLFEYKGKVAYLNALTLGNEYFAKSLQVAVANRPSSFDLYLDNPFFYEIIDFLSIAHIRGETITLLVSGSLIVSVKEILPISENVKKKRAIETCVFAFKNNLMPIAPIPWETFPNMTTEKKLKKLSFAFIHWMKHLEYYDIDAYYLFNPSLYSFWKENEQNIDFYLREFIRLRNLDQHQVETNLGRKL